MPVSVEQWRVAVGSFTSVRLVNRVQYTRTHHTTMHQLLKYVILCLFYTYTCVYMCMFVQYILSSCMVKLFSFSVSINNLVSSSVDNVPLHYTYLAKCSQYIITFMCSLQLLHLYYTLFKSLVCAVLMLQVLLYAS